MTTTIKAYRTVFQAFMRAKYSIDSNVPIAMLAVEHARDCDRLRERIAISAKGAAEDFAAIAVAATSTSDTYIPNPALNSRICELPTLVASLKAKEESLWEIISRGATPEEVVELKNQLREQFAAK